MAPPFGDQDQSPGGAAKRPAQTIEGTATEVKVEPEPGEEARAEPDGEPSGMHTSQATGDSQQASPPPPRPGRVKSFFTHCLAGLIGGLIGVAALALAWSGLDLGGETKPAPDIAALEQRLAKLEAAPSSSVDAGTLSELKSRLAALEAAPKTHRPSLPRLPTA